MKRNFTKFLVFLSIHIATIAPCKAQYKTGIGVRAGKFVSGIDVKHFINPEMTTGFEVLAGFTQEANGGLMSKAFFIKQMSFKKSNIPFPFRLIFRQSRLQIPLKGILGVGGHVGYFKDPYYRIVKGETAFYPANTLCAGIDAIIGLEYNTRKLPFTVGIDATPYYSLLNPGAGWLDIGVSVRYIFK